MRPVVLLNFPIRIGPRIASLFPVFSREWCYHMKAFVVYVMSSQIGIAITKQNQGVESYGTEIDSHRKPFKFAFLMRVSHGEQNAAPRDLGVPRYSIPLTSGTHRTGRRSECGAERFGRSKPAA